MTGAGRVPEPAASAWWARHDSGVLVFAGGAVGTLLRAGLGIALPAHPGEVPWATLLVNVLGAFVLGWLVLAVALRVPDATSARRLRLLFGTGLCGGFTTFSTFMVESDSLLRAAPLVGLGYLTVSLAAGLAAALLGGRLARAGRAGGAS